MVTILLADTDPEIEEIIHDAEAMCHDAGIGVFVHYHGEDLNDLFEMLEFPVVAFTPNGRMTLDEMFLKYGDDVILAVGGFTEDRELPNDLLERSVDKVTLGPRFLAITDVIERIIGAQRNAIENARKTERGSE